MSLPRDIFQMGVRWIAIYIDKENYYNPSSPPFRKGRLLPTFLKGAIEGD